MYPLKELISELKTELKMRVNVWRAFSTAPIRFHNQLHQIRYNKLKRIHDVLSVMTEQEFKDFSDRFEAKERQDRAEQKKLF